MASYTVFKFKNLTPLHIGTGKENYDFSSSVLQSDTLSAALASMRVMGGHTDDVKEFMDSFVISSAFPFAGSQFFLPKPQGRIAVNVAGKEEHQYRKKLKAVKFIESSIWNKLTNGCSVDVDESQLQKDFLVDTGKESFDKPSITQVTQRVFVPREEGKDTEPFFFSWTYFNSNAGLYCLVDAETSVVDEVEQLLVMLGESGLGTDKNVGGGKFELERVEMDVVSNSVQPDSSMLLSTYIPTEEEVALLNLSESKYELIQRSGFMAGSEIDDFRHLRKKSVYMFNVGSLFKTIDKLSGKIVDIKPDWNDDRMHPVYRSGKPFVVPVKLLNDE